MIDKVSPSFAKRRAPRDVPSFRHLSLVLELREKFSKRSSCRHARVNLQFRGNYARPRFSAKPAAHVQLQPIPNGTVTL